MPSLAASEVRTATFAERPDLVPRLDGPDFDFGPTFIKHDPVSSGRWGRLAGELGHLQVMLLEGDDDPVGWIRAVPLARLPETLPAEGWDWAMCIGFEDVDAGRVPTAASALAAVVRKDRLGRGLSRRLVQALRDRCRSLGLATLVAPVRPTEKERYPLIPMAEYASWRRPDGLPQDPWLRVHVRLGGRLVEVCDRSMTIPGTIAEWEDWSGLRLLASGRYVVPGGLAPVEIDVEHDRGVYVQPNQWVLHPLGDS